LLFARPFGKLNKVESSTELSRLGRGQDKTPPFLSPRPGRGDNQGSQRSPPGISGWDTASWRSVDTATRNPLLSLKLLSGLFLLRAEQPGVGFALLLSEQ
jgi:hypothetical protein